MTEPTDQELLAQAYTRRVRMQLPNGKELVAEPLDFETALHYLDLLDQAQKQSDIGAIRTIAREFPKQINAGAQLKGLTMAELFDVVRFFIISRPSQSSSSSSNRTGTSETSPSPTSSPTTPDSTEDRPPEISRGPSSSFSFGSQGEGSLEGSTPS